MATNRPTANIHSFESLATLDGAGVRYGIFFVGCPFRCVYCHNPDTWTGEGQRFTVDELAKKVVRYKPYFGKDGGVTLSGGEVLVQSAFVAAFEKRMKKEGIGVVLDTSGSVPLTKDVKAAIDGAETVILDLKFWDDEHYRKYCGGGISTVLDTLEYCEQKNVPVWIRTVIVPGINDKKECIDKYADIVRGHKCVKRYQLLAFHTMGFSKYEKLGIKNPLEGTPAMDRKRLDELTSYLESKEIVNND